MLPCYFPFKKEDTPMCISAIQKRRSMRKFLDKPVEGEKIDMLIEAALRSPSSRGLNPWEFIVVTEKGLLEKLSKAKPNGSEFLQNTPLGIVVCGNSEESDTWIEDTSIASMSFLLAAESIGLGGCWIQIRDRMHDYVITSEAYIREIIHIPEKIRIESIIALGYAVEIIPPRTKEELQYEKVYLNFYEKTYKL
jgi:nitroreductase